MIACNACPSIRNPILPTLPVTNGPSSSDSPIENLSDSTEDTVSSLLESIQPYRAHPALPPTGGLSLHAIDRSMPSPPRESRRNHDRSTAPPRQTPPPPERSGPRRSAIDHGSGSTPAILCIVFSHNLPQNIILNDHFSIRICRAKKSASTTELDFRILRMVLVSRMYLIPFISKLFLNFHRVTRQCMRIFQPTFQIN